MPDEVAAAAVWWCWSGMWGQRSEIDGVDQIGQGG